MGRYLGTGEWELWGLLSRESKITMLMSLRRRSLLMISSNKCRNLCQNSVETLWQRFQPLFDDIDWSSSRHWGNPVSGLPTKKWHGVRTSSQSSGKVSRGHRGQLASTENNLPNLNWVIRESSSIKIWPTWQLLPTSHQNVGLVLERKSQ